jgi:hypothetical protein
VHLVDVRAGTKIVHSDPPGPFVAVVDQDSTSIIDVRTGRRVGLVKEKLRPDSIVLHPTGAYLAGMEMPQFLPGMPAQPATPGVADATRVFATVDGREVTRFSGAPVSTFPQHQHVWFVGASKVVCAGRDTATPVVVVRELKLALPPKNLLIDASGQSAVSPGGQFIATVGPAKLTVYSLDDGGVAGEAKLPARITTVRALAFSPDGCTLAALIDEGMTGWHLLSWDMSSGESLADAAVAAPVDPVWTDDSFQWISDSQSALYGEDIVDVASGKSFYSIPHEAAGSTPGRVMRVNWPDQVIYDFPNASNGTKLIYKAVSLPRAEIDVALKALRPGASTTAPVVVAAKSPTTTDVAAPATQRTSMTALLQQKEWTITVVAVQPADLNAMAEQSTALQAKLTEIGQRLTVAKQQLTSVSSQFTMENYTDALGNPRQRRVYNDAAIGQASSAVHKIEDEQRTAKQEAARLEKERGIAKFRRTITGRLPDGTVCEIDVETQPLAVVADTMTEGTSHVITGTAHVVDDVLHLRPRMMAPAK